MKFSDVFYNVAESHSSVVAHYYIEIRHSVAHELPEMHTLSPSKMLTQHKITLLKETGKVLLNSPYRKMPGNATWITAISWMCHHLHQTRSKKNTHGVSALQCRVCPLLDKYQISPHQEILLPLKLLLERRAKHSNLSIIPCAVLWKRKETDEMRLNAVHISQMKRLFDSLGIYILKVYHREWAFCRLMLFLRQALQCIKI